jgi:hypothetical protein
VSPGNNKFVLKRNSAEKVNVFLYVSKGNILPVTPHAFETLSFLL